MSMNVATIKDVAYLPLSLCNKKQAQGYVQRHTICIYDKDHAYILYEI